MSIRAGMGDIIKKQVEERTGRVGIDPRWEERLRSEAYGSVSHGRSRRHAGHILRIDRRAGEVNHVSRLRHRDIGRKDSCIGHAIERQQITVEIGDRKNKTGRRAIGQPNNGPFVIGDADGRIDDAVYILKREPIGAALATYQIPIRSRSRTSERTYLKGSVCRTSTNTRRWNLILNKWEGNATDDHHARWGDVWHQPAARDAREGRVFIGIVAGTRHTNTTCKMTVLEDGDSAAENRIRIRVKEISLTGNYAGASCIAIDGSCWRQSLSRKIVRVKWAAAVGVLDAVKVGVWNIRYARRKMHAADVSNRS